MDNLYNLNDFDSLNEVDFDGEVPFINTLNQAGYFVERYEFPNRETSKHFRNIEIVFWGKHNFIEFLLPSEGFVCEVISQIMSEKYFIENTILYKNYCHKLSDDEFMLELEKDMKALYDWAMVLSL